MEKDTNCGREKKNHKGFRWEDFGITKRNLTKMGLFLGF